MKTFTFYNPSSETYRDIARSGIEERENKKSTVTYRERNKIPIRNGVFEIRIYMLLYFIYIIAQRISFIPFSLLSCQSD